MPINEKRLMIGLYGDNKNHALRAYRTLRDQGIKDAWLMEGQDGGAGLPARLQPYRTTLMPDEFLVAGFVQLPADKAALDKFRANGEHPTFILDGATGPEPVEERTIGDQASSASSLFDSLTSLADGHAAIAPVPKKSLHKIFHRAEKQLLESYEALRNSALLGHALTSTGEWLLDNN